MTTILQFGTGRFLRGFFAPIIEQPNSITVVQSRVNSSGAAAINANSGPYHVWTRGKQNGELVDRVDEVDSIARAVVANESWSDLLELVDSDELKLVVSNTTEQGLQLDETDGRCFDFSANCPASYPAKLAALLHRRFTNGKAGLTILPMELVEYNATKLRELVLQQATIWPATNDEAFLAWLNNDNRWLNNLVDRIVVSVSETPPWSGEDNLAVMAEPFRMLAIEDDGGARGVLPNHEMVEWVSDLKPIFVRKVRILNGLHTAMVAHSLPQGFATVLQAISDPNEREWLDSLLNEEILPALAARDIHESDFGAAVIERFENPFFKHQLADIAKGHAKKLTTRVQPTIDDFRNAFGKEPAKLLEVVGQ